MLDFKTVESVEKLAESLVLLDPTQPLAFQAVNAEILSLITIIEKTDLTELKTKNDPIRATLHGILQNMLPLEAAVESLCSWISQVQHVVCHGVDDTLFIQKIHEKDSETAPLPLSTIVDERILGDFLSRQEFVIDDLEALLLALETAPDSEALHRAKRILHTLKGESSLLGMIQVEQICHAMEDALQANRFDALFDAKDWVAQAFQHYAGKIARPTNYSGLLQRLNATSTPTVSGNTNELESGSDIPEMVNALLLPPGTDGGILGDFLSEANEHLEAADLHLMTLESDPTRMDSINSIFRAFHTIKGLAGFLELVPIRILSHESESLLDLLRSETLSHTPHISDVLFQAVDNLRKLISLLDASNAGQVQVPLRSVVLRIQATARGETVAKANETKPQATPKQSEKKKESPQVEVAENQGNGIGEVNGDEVSQELRQNQSGQTVIVRETVKVEADRLDKLLDTIGEMVIAEAMLMQSPELMGRISPLMRQRLVQLDKITRNLQELGTSLRMVPIRPVFQKMARLARDLSRKCGKNLEFTTLGEATEIDKTVVDRIADPLVHMVRNAVDHGIEMNAEDRIRAGKSGTASLKLSAFQKGGSICIELEEDGRGLNRQAILKKAQAAGLIKGDGSTLEDREVWPFIFAPGFSTAAQVTEVSGRGVGMDVVKRTIEDLRGRIDIQTKPGFGTRFSIWLPLTMAIIDGLVVRVGQERCIFPTLSVVTVLALEEKNCLPVLGQGQLITHQDRQVPVFALESFFGDKSDSNRDRRLVVLVETEGKIVGFAVDELLGKQQIVIKTLGDTFKSIQGLAGGGILSDGNVGLILDVDGLAKAMIHEIEAVSSVEKGKQLV
jgi:two-component system, chemotaxis family, sensor kinase CheA